MNIFKNFYIYLLLCMVCVSSVSSEQNYYEVLSVLPTASHQEIIDAYQRLAQQHHPDRGGSDEKMAEINEAYIVLKDPKLRKEYDELLQLKSNIPEGFDLEAELKAKKGRQTFYSAYSTVVNDFANPMTEISAFRTIARMSLELNNRQVRAIVHIVILDIENEHEIVPRAAIKALAQYVDQLFVEDTNGAFFSQQYFIQLLYRLKPLYQARSGIRQGYRMLKIMWESLDDTHKAQSVHVLKHLSVKNVKDGENFISFAGDYLSEEDRRSIRSQGRASGGGGKACSNEVKQL